MGTSDQQLENHHGVFVNISGQGVLIIGKAGIGKSSLALELIHQGHQLIADDVVEFDFTNEMILGHCPPLLKGLLHTRELGLISVPAIFGENAWLNDCPVHYVVELIQQSKCTVSLSMSQQHYTILGQLFPLLTLSTNNPATLHTRLLCWLSMQSPQHQPESTFKQHHHTMMKIV